jgi:hypothetical protein
MNKKRATIMFSLWAAGGVLTWYVAVYAFTFLFSPAVAPIIQFLKNNISSQAILILFSTVVLHLAEYILGALFAAFLCYLTGFRTLWFIGFLIGAGFISFYGQITGLLEYLDHYPTLPGWVLRWFCQGLVSIFILLPLASWAGCMWGRQMRLKRKTC